MNNSCNSMEFHGTLWNSMDSPWNSMELHGHSMELHGTPWTLHGTPWNSMDTPWNSMELHGTPWTLHGQTPWNSMEFHGGISDGSFCKDFSAAYTSASCSLSFKCSFSFHRQLRSTCQLHNSFQSGLENVETQAL